MKKLLAILLTAVLVCMLAACGADAKKLTRGTVEGDVYTSEYSGLTFTKPASWVYSSDEDIAAATNLSAEMYGEEFEKLLENNTTVYDMMAIDSLTGNNIIVSYENLSRSFASNITEEQYVEAMKKQFAEISYMTVTLDEKTEKVTLSGQEYLRAVALTEVSGITITQIYYLRNIDGCMNAIILTLMDDTTVSEIEALFTE